MFTTDCLKEQREKKVHTEETENLYQLCLLKTYAIPTSKKVSGGTY